MKGEKADIVHVRVFTPLIKRSQSLGYARAGGRSGAAAGVTSPGLRLDSDEPRLVERSLELRGHNLGWFVLHLNALAPELGLDRSHTRDFAEGFAGPLSTTVTHHGWNRELNVGEIVEWHGRLFL
jgi:hypothetical protein